MDHTVNFSYFQRICIHCRYVLINSDISRQFVKLIEINGISCPLFPMDAAAGNREFHLVEKLTGPFTSIGLLVSIYCL